LSDVSKEEGAFKTCIVRHLKGIWHIVRRKRNSIYQSKFKNLQVLPRNSNSYIQCCSNFRCTREAMYMLGVAGRFPFCDAHRPFTDILAHRHNKGGGENYFAARLLHLLLPEKCVSAYQNDHYRSFQTSCLDNNDFNVIFREDHGTENPIEVYWDRLLKCRPVLWSSHRNIFERTINFYARQKLIHK
jgi:hypothetical protein